MNGTMFSPDLSTTGYYTGNGPNYPSTFTTTNLHIPQPNSNSVQRQSYPNHLSQQQLIHPPDGYHLENGTAYYDHVHAQTRSHTPAYQQQTSTNSSTFQYPSKHAPSPFLRRQPTPAVPNDQHEQSFRVISAANQNKSSSPPPQSSTSIPSTFTPASVLNHSISNQTIRNNDPSLDYLHYSMDSLIQRLAPTDNYIPKHSYIYPILLCLRMNIRPSLFFNQLARLTIKSVANMSRDRSLQTMHNFLYVLSQWTRTFPYDFRNNEMMSQLEDLFKKITSFESSLEADTHHIYKKLRSKLKALEYYEEYIRQLNKKAMYNLSQLALGTDIMNECPTPIIFAQQLTHIELDRLKPVGAEELIQYFIMKLASEEARAHPNRSNHLQSSTSDNETSSPKSQNIVHDQKLTFCLEAYVQWFNRLTFFITTEIVKHTHRRSRIRLINYFIDAAYECFRLHNFNSMIGILGGLNMQPVRRLKRTWEKIQLDKFQQLEQYMDVSKNFATYRLVLKLAMEEAEKHGWITDKIVIPFTSIILQDVYYIKTHSKDYTTAGGINLKKYYSMAKFISEEFVQCKQSKCSFERNDVIINYIVTSPTFNEDSLMLASFECEPPLTVNEKDKYRTIQKIVNTSL